MVNFFEVDEIDREINKYFFGNNENVNLGFNEKDKNNVNSFMQDELDWCNEAINKYQNIQL